MQHACESGDTEAQLFAYWMHFRAGMAAARDGDTAAVKASRLALEAMADLFAGHPIAARAASAIDDIESTLNGRLVTDAAAGRVPLAG